MSILPIMKADHERCGIRAYGYWLWPGENRAMDAAKAAISSPLLEVAIDGAKGILFTITGGKDLGMYR